MSQLDQHPEFRPLWAADLQPRSEGNIAWLWHGFLAPGMTTLLTSQWKSGKTTLAAALLARMKEGGTFAGFKLRPGKAVVITEESPAHWYERNKKLVFGNHVCWFCRPFAGRPRPEAWQALIKTIIDLHPRHRFDLALVDPLQHFLPPGGEQASGMLDFLHSLSPLTAAGMAVWLQHHPRKGRTPSGQASRGSGALPGFVDILMEMNWYHAGDNSSRRRRFLNFSRFDDTPPRLLLELNADATDYINHGDFELDDFAENWKHLRVIFQDAGSQLTHAQILANWPPDFRRPDPSTIYRWLDRACILGLVRKTGLGSKTFPFQFWLPEWEKDEMFVSLARVERQDQEYHEIMVGMGYAPPFYDVPAEQEAMARRLAVERAMAGIGAVAVEPAGTETEMPDAVSLSREPVPADAAAAIVDAVPPGEPTTPVAAPDEDAGAIGPQLTEACAQPEPPPGNESACQSQQSPADEADPRLPRPQIPDLPPHAGWLGGFTSRTRGRSDAA